MFKHENGSVFLNGLRVSLDIFLSLEPSYKYPNDLVVMFYDGNRRHYRTKFKSWIIPGKWAEGDRYLARAEEFASIMKEEASDEASVSVGVHRARMATIKDKYPMEDNPNVIKLHPRDDQHKSGTEGVRSKGKRVSRSGSKRSGGATGGSSE